MSPYARHPALRVAGAVLCLAITCAAIAMSPRLPPATPPAVGVALIGLAWVSFATGAWLVLRTPVRTAVLLTLVAAVGVQLAAGFGPPRSSDDMYRYIWDGRVQAAGIDPYAHAPAAPELAELRDGFLWPQQAAWCVEPGAVDAESGRTLVPGCTLINRPAVHTIYPPVAEAIFLVVHGFSLPGSTYGPMQATASVIAIGTTVLLLIGLRRRGDDPRRAVLWAWCPSVAIEAGSNAHIDVAAAALTAAALLVLASSTTGWRNRRAAILGGALLGLAIATKVTPALVLPSVLRRRPFTVLVAVASAVALVYLPHLIAVGGSVLGYLPGYLHEEGYGNGTRFALLTWLMPAAWAPVAAVVILAGIAAVAARSTDPTAPWRSAALTVGTAIVLTSPAYTWYALLLIVLVGLGARAEWLTVAALAYVAQYAHELGLAATTAQRISYGTALAAVLVGWLARRTTVPSSPINPSTPSTSTRPST